MEDDPNVGTIVPVGQVKSSISGKSVELETQTHEIGLIVPPPDIKAIADKTAQFVGKNGASQYQIWCNIESLSLRLGIRMTVSSCSQWR